MRELIYQISKLNENNNFDYLAYIIIPSVIAILNISAIIITAIFNIKSVTKNTNKQIENLNKETYRPRLKLESVENTDNLEDEYCRHVICRNGHTSDASFAYIKLKLKNIGNGIADDIKLYTLNNGVECFNSMNINEDKNQVGFSTEEIAKGDSLDFKISISYKFLEEPKIKIGKEDYALIICDYKDLSQNHYQLLIGIIVKNEKLGDLGESHIITETYYYQEGTKVF